MAKFSENDPELMTAKERTAYDRAILTVGLGQGGYWQNLIDQHDVDRAHGIPDLTSYDNGRGLIIAYVAQDQRYEAQMQALRQAIHVAALAVGELYMTQDELGEVRITVEDEVRGMLADQNRIKQSGISVADITGEQS